MYNEKEALALLSKGDERGFRAIYDRYARAVYKIANDYLHDEEKAEDIVQEIFEKVWRGKERFSKTEPFKEYLYKTVRNHILLFLKIEKRMQYRELRYYDESQKTCYLALDANEIDLFEIRSKILESAIEKMPPQRKRVFILGKVEGWTHEKISKHLKISTPTVNNHMVLALNFLRNLEKT